MLASLRTRLRASVPAAAATAAAVAARGRRSSTNAMVRLDPQLEGIVLAWLNGTFFLTKEGGGAEAHQKSLNTSDTTKIETTGTKFGEEREKKAEEDAPAAEEASSEG